MLRNSRPVNDADDEDTPTLLMPIKKLYRHYETTVSIPVRQVHFYIDQEVGAPSEYSDMFYSLQTATAQDEIFIHLNTGGGRLDTGIQMINLMKASDAKIITSLEGNAYSLGTLIFLSGDEMLVHDYCMMMFHDYSGGVGGKGNEQAAQLTATNKFFASIAKKIYIPFLSDDEVSRVLRGEDLWMASPEIKTRLSKMIKKLTESIDNQHKPKIKPTKPSAAALKKSVSVLRITILYPTGSFSPNIEGSPKWRLFRFFGDHIKRGFMQNQLIN